MLPDVLAKKYEHLKEILHEMGSVAIGYSGGVDSTLLLKVAVDVLGPRALAMIGRSETYPTREFEEASSLAQTIGARTVVVRTEETDVLKFRENPQTAATSARLSFSGNCKPSPSRKASPGSPTGRSPMMSEISGRGCVRSPKRTSAPPVRSRPEQGGRTRAVEAPQPFHVGQARIRLPLLPFPLRHQHYPRKPHPRRQCRDISA